MTGRTVLLANFPFIALASLAAAQAMPKPAGEESGVTAYLQFGGTANSEGQVYALSPSVGYDFNPHFGMAVGAPIYFVRPSSSSSGSTINEVRAADKKVRELLDALEKASMEEQGQLGIQLQQATDEYALAIRELPI